MHGVEALGFRLRQALHAGRDDAEPGGLETAIDLADHVLGDTIGLDDGQGAFDGHANPLDEESNREVYPRLAGPPINSAGTGS